jgi:hypothetical protein
MTNARTADEGGALVGATVEGSVVASLDAAGPAVMALIEPDQRTRFARFFDWVDSKARFAAPSRPAGIWISVIAMSLAAVLGNDNNVLGALSRAVPFCVVEQPATAVTFCFTPKPHWPTWGLLLLAGFQAFVLCWSSRIEERRREEADAQARRAKHAENDWKRSAEATWAEMQQLLQGLNGGQGGVSPVLVTYFREAMSSALQAMLSSSSAPTRAAIDADIRSVLNILVDWVAAYDRSTRKPGAQRPSFSASIFLSRMKPFTTAMEARFAGALQFAPEGTTMADLPGVLELQRAWSVSMSRADADGCDDRVTPLILPLPVHGSSPLPGAVAAWCLGTLDTVSDVQTIYQGKFENHPRTRAVADATSAFFNSPSAEHIRSFFSIAIANPNDLAGAPLGTVNINCHLPGLVADKDEAEMLAPYLQAISFVLPTMLEHARDFPAPPPEVRGGRRGGAESRKMPASEKKMKAAKMSPRRRKGG